jgi:hypothetical protein
MQELICIIDMTFAAKTVLKQYIICENMLFYNKGVREWDWETILFIQFSKYVNESKNNVVKSK